MSFESAWKFWGELGNSIGRNLKKLKREGKSPLIGRKWVINCFPKFDGTQSLAFNFNEWKVVWFRQMTRSYFFSEMNFECTLQHMARATCLSLSTAEWIYSNEINKRHDAEQNNIRHVTQFNWIERVEIQIFRRNISFNPRPAMK